MFKKLIITTAFIALANPAFALFNNEHTTNNDNSVTNAPVANGGQGGNGGTGVGVGIGKGGNAKSSATGGNASATGGNATQGQIQGQIGINKSSNKNTVNTSDFNTNKNSAKQSQDASSENDISITGDTYKAAKIPVGAAYAPTILPTSDCLSAISAGGSGQFFGFSLGFNKVAKDCNRRNDAAQWANLGYKDVAVARMCQDKNNALAGGAVCPQTDEDKKEARIVEACKYPTAECKMLKKAL